MVDEKFLTSKVVPNIKKHLKEAKDEAERLQKAGSDYYLFHQGQVIAFEHVLKLLDIVIS